MRHRTSVPCRSPIGECPPDDRASRSRSREPFAPPPHPCGYDLVRGVSWRHAASDPIRVRTRAFRKRCRSQTARPPAATRQKWVRLPPTSLIDVAPGSLSAPRCHFAWQAGRFTRAIPVFPRTPTTTTAYSRDPVHFSSSRLPVPLIGRMIVSIPVTTALRGRACRIARNGGICHAVASR